MSVFKASKNYHQMMFKELYEQRQNDTLCDVKLVVEKRSSAAHKNVLAAGSPYFKSLFSGNFSEAAMSEVDLSSVTNNVQDLEAVVRFLYTGDVELDEENVLALVRLASFFLISELQDICSKYIHGKVDANSCLKYYFTVIGLGYTKLEAEIVALVKARFHDFLIFKKELREISPSELRCLIENNCFVHCSAPDVLCFMASYVEHGLKDDHVSVAIELMKVLGDIVTCEEAVDEQYSLDVKTAFETMKSALENTENLENILKGKFLEQFQEKMNMFTNNTTTGAELSKMSEGLEKESERCETLEGILKTERKGKHDLNRQLSDNEKEKHNESDTAISNKDNLNTHELNTGLPDAKRMKLNAVDSIFSRADNKQFINGDSVLEEDILIVCTPDYSVDSFSGNGPEKIIDFNVYNIRTKKWYSLLTDCDVKNTWLLELIEAFRLARGWKMVTGLGHILINPNNENGEIYVQNMLDFSKKTFSYKSLNQWPQDKLFGSPRSIATEDGKVYVVFLLKSRIEWAPIVYGQFECYELDAGDGTVKWNLMFKTREQKFEGDDWDNFFGFDVDIHFDVNISSVSNEMLIVMYTDRINGVYVADLNQPKPCKVVSNFNFKKNKQKIVYWDMW